MKSSCSQAASCDNACGDRASPAVRALSGVAVKQNGVLESTGPQVSGNENIKKDLNVSVAVPDSRSRKIDESDMKDPALAPGASRKNQEVVLYCYCASAADDPGRSGRFAPEREIVTGE